MFDVNTIVRFVELAIFGVLYGSRLEAIQLHKVFKKFHSMFGSFWCVTRKAECLSRDYETMLSPLGFDDLKASQRIGNPNASW